MKDEVLDTIIKADKSPLYIRFCKEGFVTHTNSGALDLFLISDCRFIGDDIVCFSRPGYPIHFKETIKLYIADNQKFYVWKFDEETGNTYNLTDDLYDIDYIID